MKPRKKIDSSMSQEWSEDGQVFYVDGFAYAIKKVKMADGIGRLKTVCIGAREDKIKDYPIVRGKLK